MPGARSGVRGVRSLQVQVEERAEVLAAQARRALELSIIEGAILLQDLLEAATTATGVKRAAEGGSDGRHDTGNMIASVSHDADRLPKRGNVVVGSFGWFAQEYEDYFRYQDLGTAKIPAANAMAQAAEYASERFQMRMEHIVRGRPFD